MEKVLSGTEKCPLVIVQDSLPAKKYCKLLLEEFVINFTKTCDLVYFLCCEKSCAHWQGNLAKLERLDRMPVFLDGFTDFLEWDPRCSGPNPTTSPNKITMTTDIIQEIRNNGRRRLPTGDVTIALVCDDLSPLLNHYGLTRFSMFVSKFANQETDGAVRFRQAVLICHGDCISPTVSDCLLYKSKAFIDVECANDAKQPGLFQCRLRLKRASGKYTDEKSNFKYIPHLGIRPTASSSSKSVKVKTDDSDTQIDPAANLSFNLTLTSSQKEAKSRIKLPHTYSADRQAAHLQRSHDEGKVFYQPDEADDYDEEDPDDDLNI